MQRAKPVNLKAPNSIGSTKKQARQKIENNLKGSQAIATEPPASLCKTGKDIYSEILNTFPEDFLNRTDAYVVTVIADSIAQMQKLRKQINALDPLTVSESKLVITYQKYADILKKFTPELGLSPQSRSQIANLVAKDKENQKDPLLQVLKGTKTK